MKSGKESHLLLFAVSYPCAGLDVPAHPYDHVYSVGALAHMNRSWGVEVEPPTEHGTVDDLLTSIEREGLRVTERTIRRTVFASRTDLLFVEAVAQS